LQEILAIFYLLCEIADVLAAVPVDGDRLLVVIFSGDVLAVLPVLAPGLSWPAAVFVEGLRYVVLVRAAVGGDIFCLLLEDLSACDDFIPS